MARRSPPRKVTYFEPVPPRLARNTIIESTFEVGRRFRCTMRVDCGQLDPGAVIQPVPGQWHPRMPERLDEEELADWRAGRSAIYQLAALTIGARLAVADGRAAMSKTARLLITRLLQSWIHARRRRLTQEYADIARGRPAQSSEPSRAGAYRARMRIIPLPSYGGAEGAG
jgi:hypothetical protein